MGEIRGHRNLVAWQEAMQLVEMRYRESARFPRSEMLALTSQIRRAAVSVPSNIAEGAARNSSRELLQFVGIASGSLAEVETQLEVAVRLGYIRAAAESLKQSSKVGKLIVGLRRSLRKDDA